METVFVTDDSVEAHGYNMTVKSIRVPIACSCEEILERDAIVGKWRELTSPEYPLSYCNNMHCVSRIAAPARHRVVLNITDFYTELYSDFLVLYDGRDINKEHIAIILARHVCNRLDLEPNDDIGPEPSEDVGPEPSDHAALLDRGSISYITVVIVLLSVSNTILLLLLVYK
ncbi:CUB domain protein, partial [Ostertagia ostertagi]